MSQKPIRLKVTYYCTNPKCKRWVNRPYQPNLPNTITCDRCKSPMGRPARA